MLVTNPIDCESEIIIIKKIKKLTAEIHRHFVDVYRKEVINEGNVHIFLMKKELKFEVSIIDSDDKLS